MEATTTNIPHIAGFDTLVAVNWRWLPDVFLTISEKGYRDERERAPQSISMAKQAHLSRNQSSVSRKAKHCTRRLTGRRSSTLLAWRPWRDFEGQRGREHPNDDECVGYTGGLRLSININRHYDNKPNKAPPKCCDLIPVLVNSIIRTSSVRFPRPPAIQRIFILNYLHVE